MWLTAAVFSAVFAALTAILAKCGIRKTDSDVATAIRTAVVLVSHRMPDVFEVCDRVIVMRGGEVMAEIRRDEPDFNEDDIMKAAWGERKTTC